MGRVTHDQFICLDCESTGLDTDNDRIIEVAAIRYRGTQELERFEALIDPQIDIPQSSIDIHHITQDMVAGKPTAEEVLPAFLEFVGKDIIVGHGIGFDIRILAASAKRSNIPCSIEKNKSIDTLRLARLYGKSPTNSLQALRQHFGIKEESAHRAMGDVIVNIQVFHKLSENFITTKSLLDRLTRPISMAAMPLGKHKGQRFSEIPMQYLKWAVRQDFDEDLIYSIKGELKKRGKGDSFTQSSNPFLNL